jgi:hypothetical protein
MGPMRATVLLCAAVLAACGGSPATTPSDEWDPVFPACTVTPAAAAPVVSGTKFALALYHYNIQYVAGGLAGWKPDPMYDLDSAQVEDAIVVEGLEPIVDLYLRHPTWGADLELQGYMIEVMAARHPAVLEKLRRLLAAGAVQLASVHYSDQLFLAYPRADLELSLARNDQALATGCVAAGPTVFTQEGQFGEGLMALVAAHGRTVAALPTNLFGYLHPDLTPAPLYHSRGLDVVLAGQSVDTPDGISLRWAFFNDGELAPAVHTAAGIANPYFGTLYKADPAVVAAHEQAIADLEVQGYAVTAIATAVQALRGATAAVELPPLLDSDWQPASTTMLLRWMGDRGLFGDTERDNAVLTANVGAREAVLGARAMVAAATPEALRLTGAERDLAYAVRHGLDHAARARALGDGIVTALAGTRGTPHVAVDLATGVVTPLAALPEEPGGLPVAAPLTPTFDTVRPATATWTQLGDGHYRVEVAFGAAPFGASADMAVAFPWAGDAIAYSPALLEDQVVRYPRAAFAPDQTLALPLANGLFGLGGDRWLVKDLHTVHVAAVLAPQATEVTFLDRTCPEASTPTWAFEIIDGPVETALARANALNVTPVVRR